MNPKQKFICQSCVEVCDSMNRIPATYLKLKVRTNPQPIISQTPQYYDDESQGGSQSQSDSQYDMPLGQGDKKDKEDETDDDDEHNNSGDSNDEEDDDNDDDPFSLSPEERKKIKKKEKRDKKKEEDKKKKEESGQGKKKDCSFFLRGNCRHGFLGKKEIDGKKCSFNHLMLCKKFLDNGTNSYHCLV